MLPGRGRMHLFPMPPGTETPDPVIFFDGVCGLCNHFVDFVMARDKAQVFRFAALQGETAAARLQGRFPPAPALRPASDSGEENPSPDGAVPLRSVILWEGDVLHHNSDAALRIIARLGGIWSLARAFLLVPRPLRDLAYGFVARNRYRWFGRRETCRLPTPAERKLFLP